MTKSRAYVKHVSAADYDALLPQRLSVDILGEQQPFSLLVREHNRSPDAYRIVINATELRRQFGFVAFKTILLDEDFHPASRPLDSTIGADNMWSGDLSLKARDRVFRAPNGFIIPYEDINSESLLSTYESIGSSQ